MAIIEFRDESRRKEVDSVTILGEWIAVEFRGADHLMYRRYIHKDRVHSITEEADKHTVKQIDGGL